MRRTPLCTKPKARPERERSVLVVPAVAPKPRAVMATTGTVACVSAVERPATFRSEAWLGAVRKLPRCVLCGADGVEPAHRNEGKGGAIKTHDCWTAAICRTCHRAIDQGKEMTREERRAEIDRAIVLTLAQLVLAGKVAVVR